ncbi:Pre-mRNA-processing-splicing factor 8, partial [Modicella reniformis]
PSLTDEEWLTVETTLKDLILGDFGKTKIIKVGSMTHSEIRDIFLDMKTAPAPLCQRISEIEKRTKTSSQAVDSDDSQSGEHSWR